MTLDPNHDRRIEGAWRRTIDHFLEAREALLTFQFLAADHEDATSERADQLCTLIQDVCDTHNEVFAAVIERAKRVQERQDKARKLEEEALTEDATASGKNGKEGK